MGGVKKESRRQYKQNRRQNRVTQFLTTEKKRMDTSNISKKRADRSYNMSFDVICVLPAEAHTCWDPQYSPLR